MPWNKMVRKKPNSRALALGALGALLAIVAFSLFLLLFPPAHASSCARLFEGRNFDEFYGELKDRHGQPRDVHGDLFIQQLVERSLGIIKRNSPANAALAWFFLGVVDSEVRQEFLNDKTLPEKLRGGSENVEESGALNAGEPKSELDSFFNEYIQRWRSEDPQVAKRMALAAKDIFQKLGEESPAARFWQVYQEIKREPVGSGVSSESW